MRVAIITDEVSENKTEKDLYIYPWKVAKSIELSSFEVLIIDQKIDTTLENGPYFLPLIGTIQRLLYNRGIVICLVDNLVQTDFKIQKSDIYHNEGGEAFIDFHSSSYTRFETSYDWLGGL